MDILSSYCWSVIYYQKIKLMLTICIYWLLYWFNSCVSVNLYISLRYIMYILYYDYNIRGCRFSPMCSYHSYRKNNKSVRNLFPINAIIMTVTLTLTVTVTVIVTFTVTVTASLTLNFETFFFFYTGRHSKRFSLLWHYIIYIYLYLCTQSADPNPFRGTAGMYANKTNPYTIILLNLITKPSLVSNIK